MQYISAEKEKIDFLWKVCRNYGILTTFRYDTKKEENV